MKDKNNLEPSDYKTSVSNTLNQEQYIVGTKKWFNTLYICSKNIIIKDKTLGIELDLEDKIDQFEKIVIDGITFVKEITK